MSPEPRPEQLTARWPDRLPLPTLEGYGISPGEAVLRTEMEAGPARQRRRFTDVPSRIAVRWVLRPDQFALFEAWYRWVAAEGGAWFEMDLLGGRVAGPGSPLHAPVRCAALSRPALGGDERTGNPGPADAQRRRHEPTARRGYAGSQREHRCAARPRPRDPARTPRLVGVLPGRRTGAVTTIWRRA